MVALVLHVPHGAEYLSERTFQVADDASGVDALVLQRDVRGQDQVAREPEPFEGEIHRWVIHASLQDMSWWYSAGPRNKRRDDSSIAAAPIRPSQVR